ncbi:MAG: ubiquinol-cytochrome c reductase iron-sulfur subunit [Cyanobacteria bacterium P01_D01_bin.36]
MKRRDFFNFVGLGLVATSLPIAIAACSPDESSTADSTSDAPDEPSSTASKAGTVREDGFVVIGTVTELDEAGALSDKNLLGESVIVIRDPANAEAALAFNARCTHQGCSVDWDSSAFACPCHQSKFDTAGQVTDGPATEPLGTFEAMVEEEEVLVKVS